MIIYIDMDGVLTNIQKTYFKLFGNYKGFQNMIKYISEIDPYPGQYELIKYLDNINYKKEILSSITIGDEYFDDVVSQKNIWLDRHNIFYKRNFLKTRKKEIFSKGNILIDDSLDIIKEWNNNGYGILHVDYKNTIKQLNNIINKE